MDIYHFTDYKSFIFSKIDENKHIKGYRSSLAVAAGCGRSFLSQSLNTEVHLTPDHGAGMCAFWNLDEKRMDFFLDLMSLERAASKQLRNRIQKRLDKSKAESKQLANRKSPEINVSAGLKEAIYYSSWHYSAVHTLTAIEAFQTPMAISQRLDIPTSLVERALRDLMAIGLVEQQGEKWVVSGSSIHLPKESPLSTINQANWRNQAMKHLGGFPNDGIHYSGLFALSRTDAEKLLEVLKETIQKSHSLVEASLEEELVCMNMDFFPV